MIAATPAQIVERLDRAFNEGDLPTLLRLYEDEAVVVTEPGKLARGAEELRRFFTQALQSGASARQVTTQVLEAGGVALFLSRWTLHPSGSDPDAPARSFIATTVFRRQPSGEWKILIDNPFGPLILEPAGPGPDPAKTRSQPKFVKREAHNRT